MANAFIAISIAATLTACSRVSSPTAPTVVVAPGSELVHLEAEAGSGTLDVRKRLRASGGMTVHLAPGESLSWVFDVRGAPTPYGLAVTYANGQEGANETLHVSLVTDPGGSASLASGTHIVTIESEGGDGCVEIDFIRVLPNDALVPRTGSR